jgi:hypothetical protein
LDSRQLLALEGPRRLLAHRRRDLAAVQRCRHQLRLTLGGIGSAAHRPVRLPRRAAILCHMHQLVGEQLLPLARRGSILARTEGDMGAAGQRASVQRSCKTFARVVHV